jgi:hypothetical protein
LLAKFAGRAGKTRNKSITRIKKNRNADCFRGIVQVAVAAREDRKNRVISTQKVSHGEKTRKDVDPPPAPVIRHVRAGKSKFVLFRFAHFQFT